MVTLFLIMVLLILVEIRAIDRSVIYGLFGHGFRYIKLNRIYRRGRLTRSLIHAAEKIGYDLNMFNGTHDDILYFYDEENSISMDMPATYSSIHGRTLPGKNIKERVWMISEQTYNEFVDVLFNRGLIDEPVYIGSSNSETKYIMVPYPHGVSGPDASGSVYDFFKLVSEANHREEVSLPAGHVLRQLDDKKY